MYVNTEGSFSIVHDQGPVDETSPASRLARATPLNDLILTKMTE